MESLKSMVMRRIVFSLILLVAAVFGRERGGGAGQQYGLLPMHFEPNLGQTDRAVQFFSRGPGYTVFLTREGAVLRSSGRAWAMRLHGADSRTTATGMELQSGRSHYLTDSRDWRTEVPQFGRVRYRDVYPGIDVVYYGNQRQLEYDFIVAPGADPSRISLEFEGVERVRVDATGELVLQVGGAEVRQHRPRIYQENRGQPRQVVGGYVHGDDGRISFQIAPYDRSTALVIDPVLTYSTYLGGSGSEAATCIAVDTAGNAYLAGWTESIDFPNVNGRQNYSGGGVDAFVMKLNPAGNTLMYATYLGGNGDDRAFGIAVDASGAVVLTGWTYSNNFPVAAAARSVSGGGRDAFVSKLNAAGNGLIFSTYWGGSGYDSGRGIALDGQGNAYVAGETASSNFPLLAPLQTSLQGVQDAFVSKFSSSGALLYSTYLGGYGDDRGAAIAVDSAANAYVTGTTDSTNFPTVSPFQGGNRGGQDAFVSKLNAAGDRLLYSTYLGGSGGTAGFPEGGAGIAVDAGGNAYVTGTTSSTNFPVVNALQSTWGGGGTDAFVVKLNAWGNALVYGTFFGGSSVDYGTAINIDAAGNAYVAGYTASTDLRMANAIQPANAGAFDAFVAILAPAGTSLTVASYLGGRGSDSAYGIGIDASRNIYLVGYTLSVDFPLRGAMQTLNAGPSGAFAVRIENATVIPNVPSAVSVSVPSGSSQTFSATFSDSSGYQDLTWVQMLINTDLNGQNACWVQYYRPANLLMLVNDTGTAGMGPVILGTAGTLKNGQCMLDSAASSVAASGNALVLNVALTFGGAFTGTKKIYLAANDITGAGTAWQERGTWTVALPSAVSVNIPSGTSHTFSYIFAHSNGYGALSWTQILINSALIPTNACWIHYDRASNTLWLMNDNASQWLGPLLLSAPGSLQNSHCTIDGVASAAVGSGNSLTLNLVMRFLNFDGAKTVYAQAQDTSGAGSGWMQLGTWTIQSTNSPPSVVSMNPSSGSGSSQTFGFVFTDPNGYGDLAWAQVLINSTLNPVGACWIHYDRNSNRLWLMNDSATAWVGPLMPGSAGVLQNAHCSIAGPTSSVLVSGNLTLNLALTFSAFTGVKAAYAQVQDTAGGNSGWQQRGTWTVP